MIDFGPNFILSSPNVNCETTCTTCPPYVVVVNLTALNSTFSREPKPNQILPNSIPIKSYAI